MESRIYTFPQSTKAVKNMYKTLSFYFSIASSMSEEKLIPSKITVLWIPQKKKRSHRASIKGEKMKERKKQKKMRQKEKIILQVTLEQVSSLLGAHQHRELS